MLQIDFVTFRKPYPIMLGFSAKSMKHFIDLFYSRDVVGED